MTETTLDSGPAATPQPIFVSNSSLNLFRSCPQAYAYRYFAHLRDAEEGDGPDRALGSWWHALRAADAIRRGRDLDSLRSCPEEITTTDDGPTFATEADLDPTEILYGAGAFWRTLSGDAQDLWRERYGGLTLAEHLDGMNTRWLRRWSSDLAHEAPVAVEVKFERAIPGQLAAVLEGRVDEIFLDTRKSLVVARDHKTARSLGQVPEDDLMDSQLFLYAWGVSPLVREWTGGRPINAIAYDRTRSAAPKQPQLTASGSLSKSITDYDLDTYLAWARGLDGQGVPWGEEGTFVKTGKRAGEPKFGLYTAEEPVTDRLSTPAAQAVWTDRTLTPMNMNVVRSHLQSLVLSLNYSEVSRQQWEQKGETIRNFSRSSCHWCPFVHLCRAEMIGGPGGDYDPADYGLRRTS